MLDVNLRHHNSTETKAIVQFFASVFSDSEGQSEGAFIGKLVRDMFETTDECDLCNYIAEENGLIVGSIFFSRLSIEKKLEAFMLSPVAVRSDRQGKGIGQALIRYGLRDLKTRGVEVVLTYGDPAFYQKVGFRQISPEILTAPFELSQPEGWLGQSLGNDSIELMSGRCTCIQAFYDPVYW